MNLFTAMLSAPLAGINLRERKRPRTMHAVDMGSICKGWKVKSSPRFVAVCGASNIRLVGSESQPALWPPAVKGLPYRRCPDCFNGTTPKRPRCSFRAKSEIKGGAS